MEFKNIEELYRARSDEAGTTGCSFYLTPMEWTALADAIEALRVVEAMPMRFHPIAGYMFESNPKRLVEAALARLDNL